MITILNTSTLKIKWSIKRGSGPLVEDLKRADLHVWLYSGTNRFPCTDFAYDQDKTLIVSIPPVVPPGAYGIYALWIKNKRVADTRNLERAEEEPFVAITDIPSEVTNPGDPVVIRIESQVDTHGYDGLDAYELACMSGVFTGTAQNFIDQRLVPSQWMESQEEKIDDMMDDIAKRVKIADLDDIDYNDMLTLWQDAGMYSGVEEEEYINALVLVGQCKTYTEQASTASTAAAASAASAASSASQASANATAAITTANTALSNSQNAMSNATAAKSIAEAAKTRSIEAETLSTQAKSTADASADKSSSAEAKSSQALATANSAFSAASQASQDAYQANQKATNAMTSASSASTAAASSLTRADNAEGYAEEAAASAEASSTSATASATSASNCASYFEDIQEEIEELKESESVDAAVVAKLAEHTAKLSEHDDQFESQAADIERLDQTTYVEAFTAGEEKTIVASGSGYYRKGSDGKVELVTGSENSYRWKKYLAIPSDVFIAYAALRGGESSTTYILFADSAGNVVGKKEYVGTTNDQIYLRMVTPATAVYAYVNTFISDDHSASQLSTPRAYMPRKTCDAFPETEKQINETAQMLYAGCVADPDKVMDYITPFIPVSAGDKLNFYSPEAALNYALIIYGSDKATVKDSYTAYYEREHTVSSDQAFIRFKFSKDNTGQYLRINGTEQNLGGLVKINSRLSKVEEGLSAKKDEITSVTEEGYTGSGLHIKDNLEVGSALAVESKAGYTVKAYPVTAGKKYIADIMMRQDETTTCAYFTNASRVILAKSAIVDTVSGSSGAAAALCTKTIEAPSGATKVYLLSYIGGSSLYEHTSDVGGYASEVKTNVDILATKIFNGLAINSEGNLETGYIEIGRTSEVRYLSTLGMNAVSVLVYNASKSQIDTWTTQLSERTIYPADPTKTPAGKADAKYIKLIFSTGNDKQYAYVDGEKVASLNEDSQDTTPNFIETEAQSTYARMSGWRRTDGCILLGTITDIHSGNGEKYKHLKYLCETDKKFAYSAIINMGDLGLDEDNWGRRLLGKYIDIQKSYQGTMIFAKGNHDNIRKKDSDNNEYITLNEKAILRRLQKQSLESQCDYPYAYNDTYGCGYVDVYYPTKIGSGTEATDKIRVIFVNTSESQETGGYATSDGQIGVIRGYLNALSDTGKALVISHRAVNSLGRWNRESQEEKEAYEGMDAALHILYKSFASKILCVFSGDSHYDGEQTVDGVKYMISQGYGGVAAEDIPAGATRTEFSADSNCLFDIISIKPSGALKVFRIGAGGSGRDRTPAQ